LGQLQHITTGQINGLQEMKTSPPKVSWEEHVTTSHGRNALICFVCY